MIRLLICCLSSLLLLGCEPPEVRTYNAPKEPVAETPTLTPASGDSGMNQPGADMASTSVPVGEADAVWEAPAHWQALPPKPMRKASWQITDADGATAVLSVTAFPGAVGSDLANVNRWRRELKLSQVTTLDDTRIEMLSSGQYTFKLVSIRDAAGLTGTDVAILPHEGEMWFFKLKGDNVVLQAEADNFRNFLATVAIGDDNG